MTTEESMKTNRATQGSSFRTVLSGPYNVKWPSMEAPVQQKILDKLKSFVNAVLSTRSVELKDKDGQKKQTKIHNPLTHIKKFCDRFVCGNNEITKKLERKELNVVVVVKEQDQPSILSEHLYWLCVSNGVPVCALQNTGGFLRQLFSVSVLSFGFKKESTGGAASEKEVTKNNNNNNNSNNSGDADLSQSKRQQNENALIQNALDDLLAFLHQCAKPLSRPWLMREEAPVFYEAQLTQYKHKQVENAKVERVGAKQSNKQESADQKQPQTKKEAAETQTHSTKEEETQTNSTKPDEHKRKREQDETKQLPTNKKSKQESNTITPNAAAQNQSDTQNPQPSKPTFKQAPRLETKIKQQPKSQSSQKQHQKKK